MKKTTIIISSLIILAGVIFYSCTKEEVKNIKPSSLSVNNSKASPGLLSKLVKFFNITVKVDYYEGRLEKLTKEFYPNGQLKSLNISCYNEPGICHIQGAAVLGKNIEDYFINAENGWQLNVALPENESIYHGCISSSENEIYFFFDLSKLPQDIISRFNGDSIEIKNNFALDIKILQALEMDINKMVVPKGNYALYSDGNVVWYSVDKSLLINTIE